MRHIVARSGTGAGLAGMLLLVGCATMPAASVARPALVGTWDLVSRIDRTDDGREIPEPTLGRDPIAWLVYWTKLPFTLPGDQRMLLLGVSPADANVVFGHINGNDDLLMRSPDGGMTWPTVLTPPLKIEGFAIDASGRAVVGSSLADGFESVSADGGMSWNPVAAAPHMACVSGRGDGTLFACGANYVSEKFAVGRSSDGGQTWSTAFRFADMSGPLSCPVRDHDQSDSRCGDDAQEDRGRLRLWREPCVFVPPFFSGCDRETAGRPAQNKHCNAPRTPAMYVGLCRYKEHKYP